MKSCTQPSTLKQIFALTATGLLSASVSFAIPVIPIAGSHGTLPANSFGGSGIPTSDVMLSTYSGLTLGLSANTRPPSVGPIGTDNAGTFFANTGISSGNKATWNFDFFIGNAANAGGLAAYTYKFTYGSTLSGLVSFNPLLIGDNAPSGSTTAAGNSENLGFTFLGPAISFDPNVATDYGFLLEAFSLTDTSQSHPLAGSAIDVHVAPVPDTGSTVALLGMAFAGIAGLRRKFAA